MKLSYPTHFLHDIDNMSPAQQDARGEELIRWCERLADGNANPKWIRSHLFELARLLELARPDINRSFND